MAALAAGCESSPPPGAPQPASRPPVQPAVGPWFVDRARDFGLDVVTRCGSPKKLSALDALGVGVALFDADGDGDLDLFVAPGGAIRGGALRCSGGPWLFRNDGPGRWADVSARSGLTCTGWAVGVAVADYDADGDLDLFVAHHGPDVLWQNQGDGTFRNATRQAGLDDPYWGVSATWGDADGDGWPDLYVTNYLAIDPLHPPPLIDYLPGVPVFRGPSALPGEPDILWRNRGDGTFEDVTAAAGLDHPDGKGMGAVFTDLDDDGRADLYVTNDTQANELFRNLGEGRFRDEAMRAGVALNTLGQAEGSMSIGVADVDGDGRLDLVISNFRQEGTRLYRNLGDGAFEDVSNSATINLVTQRFVGWGLALADLDDDGWPDLFQANGHVYPNVPDCEYALPPILLRNTGDGTFEDVTDRWGPALAALRSGRAVATGDLDGDGDLDLVMTTMDGPLRVVINEGRRAHHAVNLRLAGKAPNLEALGARVALRAGGRTQVGVVGRGGSMMAASDVALHFGLGPATSIDALVVRWPDGTEDRYDDLPVDSHIIIRQGEPTPRATPFPTHPPAEIPAS